MGSGCGLAACFVGGPRSCVAGGFSLSPAADRIELGLGAWVRKRYCFGPMDFGAVLKAVAEEFTRAGIAYALIGGFAMAALGVPRATGDLDFLVDGARADDVDRIMKRLGYQTLHRSPDAANYTSPSQALGHVDYLFARRPHSCAMLARAKPRPSLRAHATVKVVDAEDLIGLKVQSSINNPRRAALDLHDIQRLLEHHPELDLDRVREYFRIFEREGDLDRLLAGIKR